jgi:hypothetical protein
MSDPADAGISERAVKDALKELSWSKLEAHFEAISFDSHALEAFLGHMRRCTRLIAKHAAPAFENRRDAFLDAIEAYVEAKLGPDARARVAEQRAILLAIQAEYRRILDVLERCPVSKLPPDLRVSAYIGRANVQYRYVSDAVNAAMIRKGSLDVRSGTILQDEAGNDYAPDAAIDAVVITLGATLGMEAHWSQWFDDEDRLVLPAIVDATDDHRFKAGAGEALGMCWRRWERAEEKHRYLDAELRELTAAETPKELPPGITRVFRSKPGAFQVPDFVANERLQDLFVQNFVTLTTQTRIDEQVVGIDKPARLPPANYISSDEAYAILGLRHILSYDIVADRDDRAGLKLVEWVRGYSLLKCLARDRFGSAQVAPIVLDRDELAGALQRVGFSAERADTFIDRVTFSKRSRDLYDCPLVRTHGNRYVLVAPALLGAQVAMLILSNLGRRGLRLDQKGKAFEATVREFFEKQSLPCLSFKFTRDGDEYEFDAVVPWGDYIFLLECKNHGLSGGHPIGTYYFGLECERNLRQIRRLADALRHHPEVVTEKFGAHYVGKKVVGCVLNCLPFSVPGSGDEDVYFTDFSVVSRFFKERYLHTNTLHSLKEDKKLLHRTAVVSLWQGNRPTPEDFLRVLKKPIQFDIVAKHTTLHPSMFPIDTTTAVLSYEYMRLNETVSSFSRAVGADPNRVRNDIANVTAAIRRVQRKSSKRAKRRSEGAIKRQDRLWREAQKRRLPSYDGE